MLEFSKTSYMSDDLSDGSSEIKTMFAIPNEGTIMIATRLIVMKGYRLVLNLDGTIGALGHRVNNVTKMTNDQFKTFSEIQFADGIEATRQFLKTVEVDDSCEVFIGAVQNYRKKYDTKFEVYLDSPVHDEWSHPADAIRYLAMGNKNRTITDIYIRDYSPRNNTRLLSKSFDI